MMHTTQTRVMFLSLSNAVVSTCIRQAPRREAVARCDALVN